MKRRYRLVIVTWRDAYGTADVAHATDHAPVLVQTVGWLLCKDGKGLSVANERLADGQFRGNTFIPADMLKGIKTIRTKEAV